MLYREIIAACSQIHTKHINTLCGQNVKLLNFKPGGTEGNRWALKGLINFCNKYFCTRFPNSDANTRVYIDRAVSVTDEEVQ